MIDAALVTSAFTLGILSSTHCLGMCGGLSAALGLQNTNTRKTFSYNLAFNLGRISCYALLGVVVGSIFGILGDTTEVIATTLRMVAGLMLIAMGLYISQWWMGLSQLEKLGAKVWKTVQPFSKHLLPVTHYHQAYGLGLLWGCLPCGLIFSTLAWSSSAAQSAQAGILMFAFGLGTIPALFINALLFSNFKSHLQRPGVRVLIALCFIAFGVYTIVSSGALISMGVTPMDHSHHH